MVRAYDLSYSIIRENDDFTVIINALSRQSISTLLVLDDNDCLVGTITDGDIRRFLLRNTIERVIAQQVMFHDYVYYFENKLFGDPSKLKGSRCDVIPVVDQNKKLLGFRSSSPNNIYADNYSLLIQAGGKGKRLLPITRAIPKPLVQVNNIPLINYTLDKAIEAGITSVYISLGYLGEQVWDHVLSNYESSLDLFPLFEEQPLGTAGSLNLLPSISSNLIISNADIISAVNYSKLLNFHESIQSDITVVSQPHSYAVPFGVLDIDPVSACLNAINEKPLHTWQVCAGIYVFNHQFLDSIPTGRVDMPDLINTLSNSANIHVYPLYEQWHDVGTHKVLNQLNNNNP